jgi:DNA-binding transcriptional ArsR family regulator
LLSTNRLSKRLEDPVADDQLSRAFTALADPTRRDIVARLSLGDATPGQLAEPFAMSLQAVSKHLKVLEEAGLISRTRDAQRRPCHLETAVLDDMTAWVDRYRRNAEQRFRRLDAVLAAMDGDPQDEVEGVASP